ncbi:MAG: alpha/beta hydrolase [Burkholderiaceae bacterium]|jgi:alpha/beta superfamily hydrolase
MNQQTQRVIWPGPQGAIEAAIDLPPAEARGLALVAHPHPLFGGTLDNKVVQTIVRAFLQLDQACVRINFRGVGGSAGVHDDGHGELDDLYWALTHAQRIISAGALAHAPLALAGFSFGAFVMSHLAARLAAEHRPVSSLTLVGPATSRFRLAPVPPETFVIHGQDDDTVPLSTVFDWARPQNLPVTVLPGVGHFFHGRLPQLRDLIVARYRPALSPTLTSPAQ